MKKILFLFFVSGTLWASGEMEAEGTALAEAESAAALQVPSSISLPQWNLTFQPSQDTNALWTRLNGAHFSESATILEMIIRRAQPNTDESAAAHAELGTLLYENKLFLQSATHFETALGTINNKGLFLKRLEVGAFYEHWGRERLSIELDKLDSSGLTGRDADVVKLMTAKTLWEKMDVNPWGLTEASISGLARDGDDIWGGTWNGGIFRYTRSTATAKVFRAGAFQPTPNAIVSILVDPFSVWFAALDGLHRYHKVTEQWRTWTLPPEVQPERVQGVFRVRGKLYLATLGFGLWYLDRNDWEKVYIREVSEQINLLKESESGEVWIGTRDTGLFLWNPENGSVRRLESGRGQPPRNITAVQQTGDNLWIGTYGDGLYFYNAAERAFTRYRKSEGTLPDDWVMSLRMVDNILYVGTFGGGLTVIQPDGKTHFLQDYASPADIVALEHHRDLLYIGTLREGLFLLHIEALRALP